MNITDAPKKQPVPFGVNGQRENLLPTTPAGDNTASYDAGFPPVTMILKAAGGLPPKGQDMNQILFELSSIARWFSAGGGNQFDNAFSTAVSGYPIGAVILASDSSGYWISTTNGNTNNPENTTSALTGWIPFAQSGFTAITGLASSNVTLTTLQAAKPRITLAGTLTSNINLIFPAWAKDWTIFNSCTGSFSVICKTASGTGVTVPNGTSASLNGDGTNINTDKLLVSNNLSEIKNAGSTAIAAALANLGLGTAALANIGTGTNQVPDMNSFSYTVVGSGAVIRLPGGIIIQQGQLTTDSNGFYQVTMGVAMSTYQVIASEALVGGWAASGGVYSFLTVYGTQVVNTTQFNIRSASWRSSDKNFIAQSTVCNYFAIGRI
ncbi:hypothetical protein [Ewingella americana]